VAIGAYANDGGTGGGWGTWVGHVRIYSYSGSTWTQLGSDIDGEAASDRSGHSVSLSADATTVAIGAIWNGGAGYKAGHVRVYEVYWEYAALTATSDRVCSALTTCSSSEYEAKAPTATRDRVCLAVTTCSSSEYEYAAPTATSNRVCLAVTAPCSSLPYEIKPPYELKTSGKCDEYITTVKECNAAAQDVLNDAVSYIETFSHYNRGSGCMVTYYLGDRSVLLNTHTGSSNDCGYNDYDCICKIIQTYESAAPTATSDRVCSPLTTCSWWSISQYETVAPTATSDRVCSALTTCSSSQYESVAPTATSDRVCSALTTCSSSEYESTAPTATSDRVCSIITPPCSSSEYESVALTATNDRVCSAVTPPCSSLPYEIKPPYELKTSGTCDTYITTLEECEEARKALGVSVYVPNHVSQDDRPSGCIWSNLYATTLFNSNPDSSPTCYYSWNCICKNIQTYESAAPTATSDRVCSIITPPCSSSEFEFESAAPTATSDRVCIIFTCTCSDGTAAIGDACPIHDSPLCVSCDVGYTLRGDICEPTILTVRKVIPRAPTYEMSASDVFCSGHMVKVFDANDGSYNPGLLTASEADECAEACRTRTDVSSTSLYQWGTAISTGSWLKRTVGSPEDGECHCIFDDTECVPYVDTFPFYDMYLFIKSDSICSASAESEVAGNYVRSDCSCEYGFAGDLCLDPRMSCILSGTETPDGNECRCLDERMNNTGGCCPVGTVRASTKYASFTPFEAISPMDDSNYYKSAFYDLCQPHPGISQNESSTSTETSFSVFNYITGASEMRVIGLADDCAGAPSVDFLYDYEYSMSGYCSDAAGMMGVNVYGSNTKNPGVSKEDMTRYCFEACIGKYPPDGTSARQYLGEVHGFTIMQDGSCYCNFQNEMLPESECVYFWSDSTTYRIISAPLGCLEVKGKGITRVMNVGKPHLYTWDTKPRPMVKGSVYESQRTLEWGLHSWGFSGNYDDQTSTRYSIPRISETISVHCKKELFETYEDWIRCAARSCQGLTRGGFSMKRMLIGTVTQGSVVEGEVRCYTDSRGNYGAKQPKTAKEIFEPWRDNFPDTGCKGHIVSVGTADTELQCMQKCIDGTPSGVHDDVKNNLNYFAEGRVTKYFAHSDAYLKDSGTCDTYITTLEECKAARTTLGLSDTSVSSVAWSDLPSGCFSNDDGSDVYFNIYTGSSADCGSYGKSCLCAPVIKKCICYDYVPNKNAPDACIASTALTAYSPFSSASIVKESWKFFEMTDVYLSSAPSDTVLSFDLAPLYQSNEFQRGATVDVDNIVGEFAYHEISFDEPVAHDELTEKCSEFCGESTLDVANYYVKTSGFCTDDGEYIETIDECRDAFSSTGTVVDDVNRFISSNLERGKYCLDHGLVAARAFPGATTECKPVNQELACTQFDDTPSVRYNCYLACIEGYENDDGTPFNFENDHIVDDNNRLPGPSFFDNFIARSFFVQDDGRCYCLQYMTEHCENNGNLFILGTNYETYDIPSAPYCSSNDGKVFFKDPNTVSQREIECGEDGFNCLCRRGTSTNILTPEKARDPALHATFVGNGFCPDTGGGIYELGVNCISGLIDVDGVMRCKNPRERLLGVDWKYNNDNNGIEHPIGQEDCEKECVRRGCTSYSVSTALNLCRFSYDDSCTSLQGSEPAEIEVTGTMPLQEPVHFSRFSMSTDNSKDLTLEVRTQGDVMYSCA